LSAMQPDMVLRLQQLQEQAAQLGQLARDLAEVTPQRSQGSDATGYARVALGPDGLPIQISIRDGWQRRLEPERLGAAVLEANNDAIQHTMQAWTAQLDDSGWSSRADVDAATGKVPAPATAEMSTPPHGQGRDVNELAEHVLSALQAAQRPPADAPAPNEGADDGRHVTVQVGPGGLTACTVDPGWAARRDGGTISAALASALKRATATRPAVSSPGTEIDGLLGDALATLAALATPSPTEDGDR